MTRACVLFAVAVVVVAPRAGGVVGAAERRNGQSQAALSPLTSPPDVVAALAFAEGSTWAPDGSLFVSDIGKQRITRVLPTGPLTIFREASNLANGMLIACEGGEYERTWAKASGTPRVTRTNLRAGAVEVLAASGGPITLHGPNDFTMDSRGRLYFTNFQGRGVYRIDPQGAVTQLLNAATVNRPNGIQVSPDGATLYLVETGVGAEPRRFVRRYRITDSGRLERVGIVQNFFAADGMSIDVDGNLYVSGAAEDRRTGGTADVGVYVITPGGAQKAFYPVRASFTANNGFGGPDMKTLFIAGDERIFKVRTDVPGLQR